MDVSVVPDDPNDHDQRLQAIALVRVLALTGQRQHGANGLLVRAKNAAQSPLRHRTLLAPRGRRVLHARVPSGRWRATLKYDLSDQRVSGLPV